MRGFTIGLALALCSCGGDEEPVCTASVVPALSIRVLDDATGSEAACGATATVTDGSFSQVVQAPVSGRCDEGMLSAAAERAGTYAVVVSKAGYQDFVATNIIVGANRCHVETVTVTARMVR